MIERVGLRVVHLVIVCNLLHAPETRHAFLIKGHVIAAAFAAKGRFVQGNVLIARESVDDVIDGFAGVVVAHESDGQHFACSGIVNENSRDFGKLIVMRLDVGARAVEALLFSGEKHEADGALRLDAKLLQRAGRGHHGHGARAIVGRAFAQIP